MTAKARKRHFYFTWRKCCAFLSFAVLMRRIRTDEQRQGSRYRWRVVTSCTSSYAPDISRLTSCALKIPARGRSPFPPFAPRALHHLRYVDTSITRGLFRNAAVKIFLYRPPRPPRPSSTDPHCTGNVRSCFAVEIVGFVSVEL